MRRLSRGPDFPPTDSADYETRREQLLELPSEEARKEALRAEQEVKRAYRAAAITLEESLRGQGSLMEAIGVYHRLPRTRDTAMRDTARDKVFDFLALEELTRGSLSAATNQTVGAFELDNWKYGPRAMAAVLTHVDIHDYPVADRLLGNRTLEAKAIVAGLSPEERIPLAKEQWRNVPACSALLEGLDATLVIDVFDHVLERVYFRDGDDPEQFDRSTLQNTWFQNVAAQVLLALRRLGDQQLLQDYVGMELLSARGFKLVELLPDLEPEILAGLIIHGRTTDDVATPLRFLDDAPALTRVHEGLMTKQEQYQKGTERSDDAASLASEQHYIAELALAMSEGIEKAVTVTTHKLNESGPDETSIRNKFVVGFNTEKKCFDIAWGNIDNFGLHKDLFNDLERGRSGRSIYPITLRSGGTMDIVSDKNIIRVTLRGSSGDFGRYSHRFLETHRQELLDALHSQFRGKKIMLDIQAST